MEALLGHDHLSMRQKSHTLDRTASPSPLLIFWYSYNDCIIIDSVGQRVEIVCCVSILFLDSWFACDACTITSPLTWHILWTLNHGVQICQTGQLLTTAQYMAMSKYVTMISCILNAMSKKYTPELSTVHSP